jgi:stage III sporulation protein AH
MKKLFKKNQIIITALAVMIMVAGYLNYMGGADYDGTTETSTQGEDLAEITDISLEDVETGELSVSDEQLLSQMTAQSTEEATDSALGMEETADTDQADELADAGDATVGEATLVSTTTTVNLISEAKLNREQVRAKNKEILLEIINNGSLGDSQKEEAVQAMIAITDRTEKEQAAETLLSAKGFTDAVVSISDTGVDVVIGNTTLDDAGRAQIEDIVKRKTGVEAKNIVITPIAK